MCKLKRVTLKKVIKELAKSKITGKPLNCVYYSYDNHEYHEISNFDLMKDSFTCIDGQWQYFDCSDKNIRLYRETLPKYPNRLYGKNDYDID
jgi:hypothetical protein